MDSENILKMSKDLSEWLPAVVSQGDTVLPQETACDEFQAPTFPTSSLASCLVQSASVVLVSKDTETQEVAHIKPVPCS